jgi:hypothetical protein
MFYHERLFGKDEYLIADSGYVCHEWLITPFKGNQLRDPRNEAFNTRISEARVLIEHTNGILKNRWLSLKGVRTQIKKLEDIKTINEDIKCIITLHNLMIFFNDLWDDAESPYNFVCYIKKLPTTYGVLTPPVEEEIRDNENGQERNMTGKQRRELLKNELVRL